MHQVLVIGAGKIGSMIAFMLAQSGSYSIFLADVHPHHPDKHLFTNLSHFKYVELDANDPKNIADFVKTNEIQAIISSLPFYYNVAVAKVAAEHHLHYFDLTEDVATTQSIESLAKDATTAFIPQCGLAPGIVSIFANDLMQHFPKLETVKLRVGALPTNISNALQYALTWSTDGLINEYANLCDALEMGEPVKLQPLEGLEIINIDGITYEAFNTSGGIGSLAQSYHGEVANLNYKTIRYPGHCEKMKFLMHDLKLAEDRDTLKHILEYALPKTMLDVVLIYISVTGIKDDQLIEENIFRKYHAKKMGDHQWSAIQLTTASGACAIIDLVLQHPDKYHGFIKQEQFLLHDVITNRFGEYYA